MKTKKGDMITYLHTIILLKYILMKLKQQ